MQLDLLNLVLNLVPRGTRVRTKFRSSVLLVLQLLIKLPRNVFRIPNTDLAPFALCEFCKSVQTHGDRMARTSR
jgi:hypothetical protein